MKDDTKMKKILHIQVLPKLSGVQKVSLEIFKKLPKEYDKYILFSGDSKYGDVSECVKAFENTGAKVILSENLKREISLQDIKAFREIYSLCRAEKFDIVHTNSTKPGIVGRIAATAARVPTVIHTIHGLSFHKFLSLPKWTFYWACEMFASLFCNEITIVNNYYTKYFKWCKKKVKVVYNGLRFSDFPPPVLSEPSKETRILFVGRLDEPKNPLFLLHAAKIICSKFNDVSFTIVGDGELFEDCNKFVQDNDLAERIKLEGWQSDVYSYYQTHDILAVPSIYEAFGLIFVEAGYYSLPSVTTNVEGIPEVVKHGESGLLSSPTDLNSYVNNLEKLIVDKKLRKEMGEKARERAVSNFNADLMVEKFLKIYQAELLE